VENGQEGGDGGADVLIQKGGNTKKKGTEKEGKEKLGKNSRQK